MSGRPTHTLWARTLALAMIVALWPQFGNARVLNLHKDWIGFEVFGSYHLLSDFSVIRNTIDTTITQAPAKKTQNLDGGLNFIFSFARVRVRTGIMYSQPLDYSVTGANCFTANVSAFSIASVVGVDYAVVQTETLRVSLGGFGGMNHFTRATVDYLFSGGCADSDRTEKLKAGMSFLFGGNVGVEYGVFGRMSIGADMGYMYNALTGWKAQTDLPSGGLRSTTIAAGADAALPGLTKKERLGGLYFRFVIRSYF